MPATSTQPRPVEKTDPRTSIERRMQDFLETTFSSDSLIVVVKHLWVNKFRVNIYEHVHPEESTLSFHKMVDSKFIRVMESGDTFTYEEMR